MKRVESQQKNIITTIRVKVIPDAKKEFVEEGKVGHLLVSVRAPRKEGKANERVRELAAKHFGVPVENVRIVRGKDQSSKTLEIRTVSFV